MRLHNATNVFGSYSDSFPLIARNMPESTEIFQYTEKPGSYYRQANLTAIQFFFSRMDKRA